MKLNRLKKSLASVLSCVLALSTIALTPITAQAEGLPADVDCSAGYNAARSDRIEVTEEEKTYVFWSKTVDAAADLATIEQWHAPVIFVTAEDGAELFVMRSDAYGWVGGSNTNDGLPEGYDFQKSFDLPFVDWPSFVEANQAGVECKVTMRHTGDSAIVTLYNYGVTSTVTIPTTDKVYVVLSGDHCKLTKDPVVEDPGNDEGTGSEGVTLDCSAGWNQSSLIAVTEEATTYEFRSQSTESATGAWNSPNFVVYQENKDGALFTGRSDLFGWVGLFGDDINTNTGLPEGYAYQKGDAPDWAAFLTANKAGVDCKITMQQVGDYAIVAFSNNGVTSIVTIPITGKASVALAGELCKLTNIALSTNHIDLSAAIEAITGSEDTGSEDTGSEDTGSEDTDSEDTDSEDTDSEDTDSEDTDSEDTDSEDTDSENTDSEDTDSEDTDSEDTDSEEEVPADAVDNREDFRQNESPRIAVTGTEQTYVFTSTTNADAADNWDTPVFFVYSEDGAELFAGRSDAWWWVGETNPGTGGLDALPGYNYQTSFDPPFEDWGPWLDANKAGVECKITMRQVGDYAIVALYNNGITSITTIPTSGAAYVALSGEKCILTNITSSTDHIDLSAAIEAINDAEEDDGTDDVFLDCTGWWVAHTAGFVITEEPHTYTFHSKTYADALSNWDTPVFVIYNSDDGLVNIDNPAYREFGVIRSDNYAWNAAGELPKATVVFPDGFGAADWDADWAAWQAANRNGVDCTVTVQLYAGHVLIGVSNNGITTTYAVPADLSVTNYLSLSGELCTLSNLKESDQHIDLSGARAKADANNTPSTPAPAPAAAPAPVSTVQEVAGGEVLTGTVWWTGMAVGSNHPISGDGTWTWTIQASALVDGYGAFSVEIYDPATNGYITTGSDMNAWTAEGFDPALATVSGVPAELASQLVEGHTYTVTVTRSGNTFTFSYMDNTTGTEICTLVVTPAETVSNDVQIHVMAQVGTYVTAFNEGTQVAVFGGSSTKAAVGGEVLTGTEWWTGMAVGSNQPMSGDGTWTWTVRASALVNGYGAFSVEIYDPATNGYITTGSDMNAWTAEGFDPEKATVSGVPAELASNLVEGHTYAVTVTRSGNTFTVRYVDHTTGAEICTLVITPAETVSNDVLIHVMAQVGTYVTAFSKGTLIAALGDSVPVALYVIVVIGLAAIVYGSKKRFER